MLLYPWFLFWIPLLHMAGILVRAVTRLPLELSFCQMYMELVLVVAFFMRWLLGPKDRVSVWLLGLAVLSAPSLINSGEHFPFSLFLFSMLLSRLTVIYHPHLQEKEGVLCAYGILESGKKMLLHLALGSRESYDAWLGFLHDMVAKRAGGASARSL